MPDINLLNVTPQVASDLAEAAAFESRYRVRLGAQATLITETVRQTEAHRLATAAEPRWGGYLGIDATTRVVIGICAFKGAPDDSGTVEIAYFTFPGFEGKGYATAMARALGQAAGASPEIKTVIAHTLPEESASTRVLRKLEYECAGEIDHPEDGRIWRWVRPDRSADE